MIIVVYTVTAKPHPALAAIGLMIALAGALFRLYASGFIVKNGARDRWRLPLRAPPAVYRQHPARHRLRERGLALVGPSASAAFFWFYYPTAIEHEDRKLKRIPGASLGRVGPPHAVRLCHASAPQPGPSDRSWSLATSMQRNGELVLVAFLWVCMVWVAWRTF